MTWLKCLWAGFSRAPLNGVIRKCESGYAASPITNEMQRRIDELLTNNRNDWP